jgi:hypothetical protein
MSERLTRTQLTKRFLALEKRVEALENKPTEQPETQETTEDSEEED